MEGERILSSTSNPHMAYKLESLMPQNRNEGAALVATVGDPAMLAEQPEGPLVRMHSRCDTSELTSLACDCRTQRVTARLGMYRVRLMTNNPAKIEAIEKVGIAVTPVSLVVGVSPQNIGYLRTKRDKGGHFFPDDL